MSPSAADHWDGVYRSRAATEVSWFQSEPAMSLRLLAGRLIDGRDVRSLIDVGGGESLLVDRLIERGTTDVTVLDVSGEALAAVAARLGPDSPATLVHADVLEWEPDRQWDVWHDRAVFHFLTEPADRARYVATATAAVGSGGAAVVGTFALDGPEWCSGLPAVHYDPAGLAAEFAPAFRLERSEREVHRTPGGADQAFTWVVLRRT